jgi:C-terminal processing protease CtpA/Prc
LKKQDWEKTKQEWEDEKDFAVKNDKGKKKTLKTTEIKPIKIDFEGIYERLIQVTALPGDETDFAISKEGKTFYFTTSSIEKQGTDIYSVKWDGTQLKRLTRNGKNPTSLTLDKKNNHIYMISSKGKLSKLSLKTKKQEQLPFNAKMTINHPEENTQMFNEASKILTKKFYDPKFHGKNWEKIKKDYKNLVLEASTFKDFVDMFNIMLGQLNSSHMGLYGKDREKTQRDITGLLGVEVSVNDNGALIKRIILNSPADKVKSKLNKNDVIISIDGVKINKSVNFYSLLNNKTNEEILLEVKSSDNIDNIIRKVVIRPTKSLRRELYEQWVRDRKNLTEKYSNGRLGYLHIKGMNMVSFERFEREITSCGYGKEGIVIDVRFNGGGWTTDYLMAVLNVKQHSYTIPRGASDDLQKNHRKFRNYYAFGERLPFAVWTKPSIAICNANSYSNAEIFSHAYKTLGIGKLVGIPTFGAVISTGGARLLNGSFVRVPFRGWYVKATDKNMEHKPAVPDVIVQNSPDSKAKGVDEQLKKAVKILLKQINKKKKNINSY